MGKTESPWQHSDFCSVSRHSIVTIKTLLDKKEKAFVCDSSWMWL